MRCVKNWLRANDHSTRYLAKLCKVSPQYMGRLLDGQRQPSVDVLRVLHEVTGLSAKRLLLDCTNYRG